MVTNPSGLSEEHAAITSALGDQIFVFDPCDDGNETWVTREAFVARLGALEPIKTPSAIFQTVLSVNDEVAYSLRTRICLRPRRRMQNPPKGNRRRIRACRDHSLCCHVTVVTSQ